MRVVLRVLFFEFALSWAMVLAGPVRVAIQLCQLARQSGRRRRRAWRLGAMLFIGIPVVAGWPALFLPVQAQDAAGNWLKIAIPWWILIGALGAQALAVRLTADT